MAQAGQIVRDALGHLKVLDANGPVKPIAMRDGLRALNLMVRAWESDGLTLGWTDVDDPTDPLPAPPEAEEVLGYQLAIRLRASYGVSLDADVIQMATEGLATLSAAIANTTFAETEYPDLPVGEAQPSRYGWREGYTG